MGNYYDGILSKPFLSEHIYKGTVAALAIWVPIFFLFVESLGASINFSVGAASTVSIIAAVAAFTFHNGFSIDIDRSRYRSYVWVLGLHFGKWQKLPSILHVVVKPVQRKHDFPVSNYPVLVKLNFIATEQKYQVLLSILGSQIGIIAAYSSQAKANAIAAELGQLLRAEILTF